MGTLGEADSLNHLGFDHLVVRPIWAVQVGIAVSSRVRARVPLIQ